MLVDLKYGYYTKGRATQFGLLDPQGTALREPPTGLTHRTALF